MDALINTLAVAFALIVLLGILAVANLAERQPWARLATPLLVFGVNGLIVFNGLVTFMLAGGGAVPSALLEDYGGSMPTIAEARGALIVSLLTGGIASVLLIPEVRRRIAPIISPAFNPASTMHMIGLVLSVYLVGLTALQFALAGDLTELASEIGQTPVLEEAVLQAALLYIVSAMGVGFLQRRAWRQTLARLGLVWPTWQQAAVGVGLGLALVAFQFGVLFAWVLLAGEEAFAAQTQAADALTGEFDTLSSAFLISFTSSTSEEIAFRGALQPGLGVGLTSVVFALSHIQYALTPATLVILVLAVALGLLRERTNTTTAILCHFVYNFTGLSVAILAQELLEKLQRLLEAPGGVL
jgi:membrane protease YdiL (CAAX protease family)